MTRHVCVVSAMCVWGVAVAGSMAPQRLAPDLVSFERDVRPIFQSSCQTCHGDLQTSGLDLRTRDSAMKGGDNGAAIVPGRAEDSRLYRRIAGLEQPSMPLDGALAPPQIAIIKAWIDQGAHWDGAVETPPAAPSAD